MRGMPSHHTDYRPPFCPNPNCDSHVIPKTWRFVRCGFYERTCPRVRRVQRFRCSHCRRNFSRQTFQTTYWLRRPELLATILERLEGGSGYRQIARSLGCSPTTVMTHASRLGRHSMLFLQKHRPKGAPREPVVVDGFESFAYSQYYPLHLNLAVGAESHFVYALTESELRRKGRMRPDRKEKRTREEREVGRPHPRDIERGMTGVLEIFSPPGSSVTLRSDEHRDYPRAIRNLPDREFCHEVTPSKQARIPSNPLFPVNRQDLMLRHCGANHRRETIAFSKSRASVIERAFVQAVFMNFRKSFSEKKQDATPAQRLGLVDHKLSVREVLRERLFATRTKLPPIWQAYYERRVRTRRLPNGKLHQLRFAF
jgi:hypothetical protein